MSDLVCVKVLKPGGEEVRLELVDGQSLTIGRAPDNTVAIADDGEMALKVYREHMDEIDLVIMDVIMPKMNGYECMKELRKINPQIKIIVESGYSSSETILKMKQLGIHGLIHKPSSGGTIRTAIKEALLSQ